MRPLSLFLFVVFLCQCSTTPEKPKPHLLPKSQSNYRSNNDHAQRYNDIDINALLYELNMDQPLEQVGYQEKAFNTCEVSSNRSQSPECEQLYLSRLNFQVMCRNSTGTVEKVHLQPLSHKQLQWKGVRKRGTTSTNSQGYGSLGFVSRQPASSGHLYFYLGSKIARKRLQDKWKLVLPRSWCDHH